MMLLLLIQILLCYFVSFTTCSIANSSISKAEVVEFLQRYGYVTSGQLIHWPPPNDENDVDLSPFKTSIKEYQQFVGLSPTGELDEPTRKKMTEPRCGVSDVQYLVDEETFSIWNKTEVTYSIEAYSNNLPREDIRRAIAQGFLVWSAVTPLVFKEVQSGGDIQLSFEFGRHRDNDPFDGKGGTLAHAFLPTDGRVHFDDGEDWAYMDASKIHQQGYTDLLPVAIHEIGHSLGLGHSGNPESIMAPYCLKTVDSNGQYKFPKLAREDIKKIQDLYGGRTASSGKSSGDKEAAANRKRLIGGLDSGMKGPDEPAELVQQPDSAVSTPNPEAATFNATAAHIAALESYHREYERWVQNWQNARVQGKR